MFSYHLRLADQQPTITSQSLTLAPLAANEIRIAVHAASLNYRDLLVFDGLAAGQYEGRIPLSDMAGVVTEVGADVTRWQQGDRVIGGFFRDWRCGPFKRAYRQTALGGDVCDGVLAERVTTHEFAVTAMPDTMTMAHAATLPCAGVTAWQALMERGQLRDHHTLVIQGTGGVALFALQIAHAVGARTIVLSSSDDKLAKARALGAYATINYRQHPQWAERVLQLTEGEGASHILELGGQQTFAQSLTALAAGGKILQIGVLSGGDPAAELQLIREKNADVMGITVGSVEHLSHLLSFMEAKQFKPVVDREFPVSQCLQAYQYLRSQQHMGKVVLTL